LYEKAPNLPISAKKVTVFAIFGESTNSIIITKLAGKA
jgi:hypothetical protein